MLPDFTEKLRGYVDGFNPADEEIYINDIGNADAFDFLRENAPLFDCPDAELFDTDGFSAPYGLTTAERRHPRFMFKNAHECLWNGYVWPYATSQTLTALANMIRVRGDGAPVSKEDYYALLRQYALSHRLKKDDGSEVCFIDENMHPFTTAGTGSP